MEGIQGFLISLCVLIPFMKEMYLLNEQFVSYHILMKVSMQNNSLTN